jgi:hypothetical protein
VNYSIQFAAPKRRGLKASIRAMAWAKLLEQFLMAHPGRDAASVTVLEVSGWKASRK